MPSKVSPFRSLRTKFMLFACSLVMLFSVAWGSWTWTHEQQMLRQRLEDAGTVLISSMAIPIINALLYEELGLISEGGLLDNFVIDIMGNPQLKPVYAIVTDTDGKILAHSQISLFGQVLADELTRKALAASEVVIQQQQWQGQTILDLGSPLAIHGKRWGCLRVGVPLAPLEVQMRALALRVISFSCLFAFGALFLFFIAGTRLVFPLRRLAVAMEQIDGEQLTKIPKSRRRDELGLLQNSFSRMLSRLRRSERERDESFQHLLANERLVAAGQIVAGVTHEINNPLAGIQGALYALEKKPQTLNQYLPLLQEEVERISGIVSQLLDLSRADELDRVAVNSRVLTEGIVQICRLGLKNREITLHLTLAEGQQFVSCDPHKVQQVVLNLVLNAADAMEDKGQIELKSAIAAGHFCFQVCDNGPGVPEHLREQIFTPFFTTKPAGVGTGIGLAYSMSIIEKHGGVLQLLPANVATGACFELKIPLRNENDNGHQVNTAG